MIVTLIYPSSPQYTGGVVVLYEFANGLARRGHQVRFLHAPANPYRIDDIDQLGWFDFDPAVTHYVSDVLDHPAMADGDVVFAPGAAPRLGLPVVVVQGFGMVGAGLEIASMRERAPKVCVARWLLGVGATLGVPAEQLWYVPAGIDHDRFTTPEREDRPVDVAVLHNLHPAKGWDVASVALDELRRRRPGLRVTVFGIVEPPVPLPSWMEFHLAPGHDELVTEVYRRAKVFLQPSSHEGFGLTAVEAMACGCALVTTDNGGSADYAFDGETAVVVPVEAPEAMADALERLLDDDDRRRRLAAAGERHVRRFRWEGSVRTLEAHLERYVADPDRFREEPAELSGVLELPGLGSVDLSTLSGDGVPAGGR